jgi:hypothetical protein
VGDKVSLAVQLKPQEAGVTVSIDGTAIATNAAGLVSTELSIADSHTVQVPREIPIDPATRRAFVKWSDGETSNSRVLTAKNSLTLIAEYKTQYLLTVNSATGDPQGSGWYDEGSPATISVKSSSKAEGLMGLLGGTSLFDHWSGDLTSSTPTASLTMNGPKTANANWRTDNTIPYAIIGSIGAAIAAALVVAFVATKKRHREPSP